MNVIEQQALQRILQERCDEIARRWNRTIVPTAFSPHSPEDVQRHLLDLTEQVVALFLADTFKEREAAAIGAALARMHYLQPASLAGTQVVLANELVTNLSAKLVATLQPRLAALLGEIASGYFQQAREMILAEQETIRTALLRQRARLISALRESEARFRAIFSGAAIGIVLADVEGHVVESNPAIQGMLGYTSGELQSMTFTAVTHPEDVLVDWEHFRELVAGQRGAYQLEKRYLHKDGHVVWGKLTVSLLRDGRDTPQFTVGMVEDISERKQMAAALTAARRRLAESSERERLRIARDLHDVALQDLLDINRHLAETRERAGEYHAAEVPITTVAAVQGKVQEITAQLRGLIRELRPPGLEEFGLIAALEGHVADLQREHTAMPAVVLDMQGDDTLLPLAISLPLFRAGQEALRNVLEHACAQHVTLHLRVHPWEAILTVRDDGIGFAVPASLEALAREGHFGLIGIAERVALAGGAIEIASHSGVKTEVAVRVPVPSEGGGDDGTNPGAGRG